MIEQFKVVESAAIPDGKAVLVSDRQIAVVDLASGRVSVGDRPKTFPDYKIIVELTPWPESSRLGDR